MTTTTSFQVTGFKELESLLKELPDELAAKVLTKAFQQGAMVVRDAAKANAPVMKQAIVQKGKLIQPGALKRSIRIIKPSRIVKAKTMIINIVRAGGRAAPHAWLVENGSGPRVQKNGRKTGSMPANPFMRRTIDATASAAVENIKNVCTALIDHVSTDLARKVKSIT